MLRVDIITGVSQIGDALTTSGLLDLLELIVRERQRQATEQISIRIIEVYRKYSRLTEDFNDAAKEIHSILNLDKFNDVAFWSCWLTPTEGKTPNFITLHRDVKFALQSVPKILKLLERDVDFVSAQITSDTETFAKLTTILVEDKGFSSPQRLVLLFQSICGLYEVLSDLSGERYENLSVAACDSGSDKTFDFLGTAKGIEEIKEIILQIWDRVVFHRENKATRQLDVIAKTLPVLERIGKMEAAGSLGPEQAEILRRKATESVTGFVEAGAIIPEIDDRVKLEPRKLMAPELKLLVAPDLSRKLHKDHKEHEEAEEPELEIKCVEKPVASRERKKGARTRNASGEESVDDLAALLDDPDLRKRLVAALREATTTNDD